MLKKSIGRREIKDNNLVLFNNMHYVMINITTYVFVHLIYSRWKLMLGDGILSFNQYFCNACYMRAL